MAMEPLYKIFKTPDKHYLYDTNKNEVITLTQEQYRILKEKDSKYYESLVDYLQKAGYLSTKHVLEVVHSLDDVLPYYLDNNVEILTLQVTQQCNFRCEYCVYSGGYHNREHSSKRMSLDTAKKAIDFAIQHSKCNEKLGIAFYGGEPLLEFELIKECIEYANKRAEGKKLDYNMTTNASLLTDEVIQFLSKNKVRLTISLDGPKEIHDGHRKRAGGNGSTYDWVMKNLKNVKDNYPEYYPYLSINAVVDTKNDFYTIDEFFKNESLIKHLDVLASPISDCNIKEEEKIEDDFYMAREYEVFRQYYNLTKRKPESNCKMILGANAMQSKYQHTFIPAKELSDEFHHRGPCVPGSRKLFVTVDGEFYPCEKCSESSKAARIGSLDTGFDIENARKVLNIGKLSEEACKNCWAIRLCHNCVGQMETTGDELTKEAKAKLCNETKMVALHELLDYCVLKEFNFDLAGNDETLYFMKNVSWGEEKNE